MSIVDQRLARLLDAPSFARVVPHLAAETLHQVIHHRGLEACGDLLTAVTPAQLTALLDLDLWRHFQPGRDEQFDADRFGEWLEVLIDAGESAAARAVAAMDPHLVVVGLSRYIRPFDPGTFEPTEQSDDEVVDRHGRMHSETSADVLECEVGGYLVRARREDSWDAVVALLVVLESDHSDRFHALMQGCRRLSNSRPESDGLDDLLLAPEQHLHDVAIERARRRARRGYATPAEARAFLQMARLPRATSAASAANPIAADYFRAVNEADDPTPEEAASRGRAGVPLPGASVMTRGTDDITAAIDAVVELLSETGVTPQRPRALLDAGDPDANDTRHPLLTRLLAHARQHDDAVYLTRSREMAFLANVLLAGCSVQSRPFTAQEASEAVASVCNLGLEHEPAPPEAYLVDHDLVTAFEAGWAILYRDVSLCATDRLIAALGELHGIDDDTRDGVQALRRALERQRGAGTPWLARDAADVLATLDTTAWVGLLGLLDECPILPAALTAVLEGDTASVSPGVFEFISRPAQIGDVRLFLGKLPGLLAP